MLGDIQGHKDVGHGSTTETKMFQSERCSSARTPNLSAMEYTNVLVMLGDQQPVTGVTQLGSSIYSAVGDTGFPLARDKDVLQHLMGSLSGLYHLNIPFLGNHVSVMYRLPDEHMYKRHSIVVGTTSPNCIDVHTPASISKPSGGVGLVADDTTMEHT
ncbi:hypothetical protein Ahia01_000924900 [Argonauta hians]